MNNHSFEVIGDVDVLVEIPIGWYSDEPVRLDVIGGNTRVEYLAPGSSVGLLCDDAVIAHADGVVIEQMRGFSRIELLEQSRIGLVTDAATIGNLDSTSDVGTLTGYARVLYCAGGVGTLSGDAVIHCTPSTRRSTSPEAAVQWWLRCNAVPGAWNCSRSSLRDLLAVLWHRSRCRSFLRVVGFFLPGGLLRWRGDKGTQRPPP